MNWRHGPIPHDDEGNSMFIGSLKLYNDRNEVLAHICWFDDAGPFYSYAVDLNEPKVIRRIGPCETLVGAKRSCIDVIEGTLDVSKRAGYPR